MRPVPQHQLECMLARWQFNNPLSLTSAEMKMSLILWDWLVWVEGVICVDQQMMVTGVPVCRHRPAQPPCRRDQTAP